LTFTALYAAVLPPRTTSATARAAASTHRGFPVMVTTHGVDVWSIWILAPVVACKPFTVSPPLPMTRPTISFGHRTSRLAWPGPTPPPPKARPPLPVNNSSISRTAIVTHPLGPEMEIFLGTPSGKFWSMVMCAPD
jgi:hypothetical protein